LRKLIIIAGSIRMNKEPVEPIAALQRFDGAFARLIRKYKKQLRDSDIFFLSPAYGMIEAGKKIEYREPTTKDWHKPVLTDSEIRTLRESTSVVLEKLFRRNQYDEIYVNVGKSLWANLQGFEAIFPKTTKVTFAQGRGIGPKMSHMKAWIESNFQNRS